MHHMNFTLTRYRELTSNGYTKVGRWVCKNGGKEWGDCKTEYTNVERFDEKWSVESASSSSIKVEPTSVNAQASMRLYKNQTLLQESSTEFKQIAEDGELFSLASLNNDIAPNIDAMFGSDAGYLNRNAIRFDRYIVESVAKHNTKDDFKYKVRRAFRYFVERIYDSAFDQSPSFSNDSVQVSAPDTAIWYGVNYKNAFAPYLKKLSPNYNEITIQAYDSLTYLPIRSLKINMSGHEPYLYSRKKFEQTHKLDNIKTPVLSS